MRLKEGLLFILSILFIGLGINAIASVTSGTGAGSNLSSGNVFNVALGEYALRQDVTSRGNIAIGAFAGATGYDKDFSVYIGHYAGYDDSTSQRLYISNNSITPLIYGEFDNNKLGFGGKNASAGEIVFIGESDTLEVDFDGSNITLRSSTGEIGFSGAIITNLLKKTEILDANDSITASQSGTSFFYRPLSAKRTALLPTAATGLYYDFMVADTDSLRITSASGDSIITDAGVAFRSTGSVAGVLRLVAIDAVRWLMTYSTGTWTGDKGNSD